MELNEERGKSPQLDEISDSKIRPQVDNQMILAEHPTGSAEEARSQASDSDREFDSPKGIAQVPDGIVTKKGISVPSTDKSDNQKPPMALNQHGAFKHSTATVKTPFSDQNGFEQTSGSFQIAPSADHSEAMNELRKGKERANERVRNLENDNDEMREEINELEREIQALEKKGTEREATIRELQNDRFKLFNRHAIDALPDDEVRNEFKKIFARARSWMAKWVVSDANIVALRDIKTPIRLMLNGHQDRKSASNKGLQAAYSGTLKQRLILTTLVTRHLASNLFERPFFYLQNPPTVKRGSRQKSAENQLLQVLSLGIAGL